MANYRPLAEVQVLSDAKQAFLEECAGFKDTKICRRVIFDNTLSSVMNPDRPDETLLDEALRADKLHDRHPELIVSTIEGKLPGFFDTLPTADGVVNIVKKKAFISEYITCVVRLGQRRYGKPNLRKVVGFPVVSIL